MAILRTQGLSKTYRTAAEVVHAVEDVSFELGEGEAALISGASGSGKTTLLNLLGLLARPTRGTIEIDGQEVSHLPEHFLSRLRRRQVGFVFQQYNLLRGVSALDNVAIPLVAEGIPERRRRQRAAELLERFSLTARADFPVNQLSGGEQQRVAIARALVNDPRLVIADEPDANLDEANAQALRDTLAEIKAQGRSLIIASHDRSWRQDGLIERVLVLERGKAVATYQRSPDGH